MGIVCAVLETVYEPYAQYFTVFLPQMLNFNNNQPSNDYSLAEFYRLCSSTARRMAVFSRNRSIGRVIG
jgi:hypothetical protein